MTEELEHRIRVLTKRAEALSRMTEHSTGIEGSISKGNANEAAHDAWKDVLNFWECQEAILDLDIELDSE